jgi:transcriptional regulator with XRE-family HTH domain
MPTRQRAQTHFGRKLAALRGQLHLRREQVAQRAAISVDLLQSLEQGRMANPSARTILGLARALGVPYTELMDCLALDLQEERRRQLATEKEKELDLLIAGAAAGEAADSGS